MLVIITSILKFLRFLLIWITVILIIIIYPKFNWLNWYYYRTKLCYYINTCPKCIKPKLKKYKYHEWKDNSLWEHHTVLCKNCIKELNKESNKHYVYN